MTVKVTQLEAEVLVFPETTTVDVQVSMAALEVMGDAPPYPPGYIVEEFIEQDASKFSPGGFDVWFDIPALASGESVLLRSNCLIDAEEDGLVPPSYVDSSSRVVIENRAGELYIGFGRNLTGDIVEEGKAIIQPDMTAVLKCRINYHENHITVYVNGRWMHTYSAPEFVYLDPLQLYLWCSVNKTLTNIRVTELHDWRHAIFTETESDGASVVSSIIQERPVEIYIQSDGKIQFYYNVDPTPIVPVSPIRSFSEKKEYNEEAASDYILYYRDVETYADTNYPPESGFVTKILRLSGLDNGAKFAARVIARRARERERGFQIIMRPDFRIEVGDVITLNVTESGTGTAYNVDVFVESCSTQMKAGEAVMRIRGRLHAP